MIIFIGIFFIICVILGIYASGVFHPHLPELFEPETNYQNSPQSLCIVCGEASCIRQKPNGDHQPWVGLDVPRDVDQALQDLINKLLNEYIVEWYGKVTSDTSFLWELRGRLRFACSILLRRILRVNIGEMICEKLVPLYLRHIDDFAVASAGCPSDAEKVATVVAYLGERVHPAARSRQSELDYLRSISRTLVNIGVLQQDLKCRPIFILLVELLAGWVLLTLADVLCSPFILNSLLMLALSKDKSIVPESSSSKVQFLKAFATKPFVSNQSAIRPGLRSLLNEQKYLYQLIQYMKRVGAVNLLQFCLDVEDFNSRILVPDIPLSNVSLLHKEAWQLYNTYFAPGAVDVIRCSPGIPEQFQQVLSKGEDITRLQTCSPLYHAYEETFCIIEQVYLPGFYQSDLYFELLCTRRQPAASKRSSPLPGSPNLSRAAQPKAREPLVSKLSQKLQKLVSGGNSDFGVSVDTASDASELEDDIDLAGEFEFRNMSQWDVRIPVAEIEQVANSRPYPVFIIRVIGDSDDEVWEVRRKLTDFYTLQSKLLEFHQKLPEELPLKKGLFSPRGEQYLEGRRQSFETYLQRMICHPELCCSDLLHCFLRSPAEFQTALRNPISLYGIIRRSVEPIKLRKERGRHLDHFIASLTASIDTHSDVPYDIRPVSSKRDITCTCFNDNLAPVLRHVSSWAPSPVRPILRLVNFWDCLLFIMWKLVGCGSWIQRLVLTVKVAMGHAASSFIYRHINYAINSALLPRLPNLIRLLQGAILSPSPSKINSMDEARKIYEELCHIIKNPSRGVSLKLLEMAAPRWQDGVMVAMDTLQHPTLNKHLFYCLLDELLRTMFSEFSAPPAAKS